MEPLPRGDAAYSARAVAAAFEHVAACAAAAARALEGGAGCGAELEQQRVARDWSFGPHPWPRSAGAEDEPRSARSLHGHLDDEAALAHEGGLRERDGALLRFAAEAFAGGATRLRADLEAAAGEDEGASCATQIPEIALRGLLEEAGGAARAVAAMESGVSDAARQAGRWELATNPVVQRVDAAQCQRRAQAQFALRSAPAARAAAAFRQRWIAERRAAAQDRERRLAGVLAPKASRPAGNRGLSPPNHAAPVHCVLRTWEPSGRPRRLRPGALPPLPELARA